MSTALPRLRLVVALFIATVLLVENALADVILMNNGDRLTGTVGNITNGVVTFNTSYAGDLSIAMAEVSQIETDGTYDVTLKSGDTLSGQLSAQGLEVGGNLITSGLADISVLAPPEDDALSWTSRVDALASVSNGNADTQALNIFSQSTLSYGDNEHLLNIAFSDEEADSERTKEQIEIDYGYRRYLRNDWYAAGNVEYFRDALKDIDRRITVGAAVGKQFWSNPKGALAVELGVSQVFENLDGENESNPALRWALNFNRYLTARAEIFHTQEILTILGSGRGQIYDTATGLRYNLSDNLNVSLRADLRHESDPPENAGRSDITYGIGVGYIFR